MRCIGCRYRDLVMSTPRPSTGAEPSSRPSASLIVLTMGDRPDQLSAALASATAQRIEWSDVIVVSNGAGSVGLGGDVVTVELDENVGVPAGRNAGANAATGDVLVFLDDDATFEADDVVAGALDVFAEQPETAVVAFRIADDEGWTSPRHVPRLRGAGVDRPGVVTGFLGGAVAIRRAAFDDVHGYSGDFVYSMEESDLALALIDRDWSIRYEPALRVRHPRTEPSRHPGHIERNMRNRVLLARRRLPVPIGIVYVLNWCVIVALRSRLRRVDLAAIRAGLSAGIRSPMQGGRSPIRWRTVVRLTRLGRPPII